MSSEQISQASNRLDAAGGIADAARPSLIRLAAIVLWVLQLLTMTLMLPLAVWKLETILGSGLVLTVIGLLLAVVATPLRSWTVLSFALSGPLICMVCARMIAQFNWNPPEASRPIPIILGLLSLLTLPLAVMALVHILSSHRTHPWQNPFASQYSLKSLLIISTVFCLAIGVIRAILVYAPPKDYFGFDLFNLSAGILTAGAVFLFVSQWRAQSVPPIARKHQRAKKAPAKPGADLANS